MSSSDPTSTEDAAGSAIEASMKKRPDLKDDSLEIELGELAEGSDSEPVTVDMATAELEAASAESAPAQAEQVESSEQAAAADEAAPVEAPAVDGSTEASASETSSLVDGPPPTPPRDPMPEDFSDAVATALAAGRNLPAAPADVAEASSPEASVTSTQESDVVDADAMVESVEAVDAADAGDITESGAVAEAADDADESLESLAAAATSDVTPGPEEIAAVLGEDAPKPLPLEPPSDEELLDNVVLPPGMKGAAAPAPVPLIGDADRTVISEMPPEHDDRVASYPPLSWATQPVRKTEIITRPTLQAKRSVPIGTRVKSIAGRQVQTSVAQLALLVVAASVMGAAAIKAVDRDPSEPIATVPKLVPASRTTRIDVATAPRPPEIAPLPSHVEEAKPIEASTPVTIEPAPRRVVRKAKPAAAPPAVEVAAVKPAPEPAVKPAPPVKKAAPVAAPAAKPRTRRVAQHTDWVDPFGQ
jgi:hypothetical protein